MRNNSLLAIMDQISETPPLLFEKFTDLNEIPLKDTPSPWNEIGILYNSKIHAHKIAGIILNGAITNQKPKFLFSYRICNEMIKVSGIDSLNEISGTTYRKVLAQLTDPNVNFMRRLEEEPKKTKGYKAWTFELTYPPAQELIQK